MQKYAAFIVGKAASEGRLTICKWLVTEAGCDASVKDNVSCVLMWLSCVMHK